MGSFIRTLFKYVKILQNNLKRKIKKKHSFADEIECDQL